MASEVSAAHSAPVSRHVDAAATRETGGTPSSASMIGSPVREKKALFERIISKNRQKSKSSTSPRRLMKRGELVKSRHEWIQQQEGLFLHKLQTEGDGKKAVLKHAGVYQCPAFAPSSPISRRRGDSSTVTDEPTTEDRDVAETTQEVIDDSEREHVDELAEKQAEVQETPAKGDSSSRLKEDTPKAKMEDPVDETGGPPSPESADQAVVVHSPGTATNTTATGPAAPLPLHKAKSPRKKLPPARNDPSLIPVDSAPIAEITTEQQNPNDVSDLICDSQGEDVNMLFLYKQNRAQKKKTKVTVVASPNSKKPPAGKKKKASTELESHNEKLGLAQSASDEWKLLRIDSHTQQQCPSTEASKCLELAYCNIL